MVIGFSSFAAGQYLPLASVVHGMDPRLKLGAGVVLAGLLFAVQNWWGLGVCGAGLLIALMLSRVPLGYMWRFLRPFVVILAITLFLQAVSLPGDPLLTLGPLSVTRPGLEYGGFVVVRLLLLVLSGGILVVTTPPVAVTDAVAWYLFPLGKVGIPVGEVALVTSLALRFVPMLMDEFRQLVKAQRARGIPIEARSPLRAARALLPLLIPLFVLGFRRAEEMADAMLSRCYRGAEGRTHFRVLRFSSRDLAWLMVTTMWLASALALGRGWVAM